MDSGTHLMYGLGLGGLAMVDPAFASHPYGTAAVLLGTIAGSNAPDLDMLIRFKGNAEYIRHHRGLSHSLPAILAWTAMITLIVKLAFRDVPWPHLAFWIGLSVVVHVTADLFNAYGTQAFRPFTKAWVKWSAIPIFDPFVFSSHLLAVLLWASGAADPRVVFPVLYALVAAYYAWRTMAYRRLARAIPESDPDRRPDHRYALIPTISSSRWRVVRRSPDGRFNVGQWNHGRLEWHDTIVCEEHPAIEAAKSMPDVQAFLSVVPFPCATVRRQTWGYEVRWQDVRFRYRKQYPFAAIAFVDDDLAPLQSYVGWLSADRLEKRLRMTTY